VHDNSAENFRNPSNPPARVKWGEQTTDEMSAAILQLVPVNESDLPKLYESHRRRILGGFTAAGSEVPAGKVPSPDKILERFDANKDGKLDLDELATASGRPKEVVKQLANLFDRDGDGALDKAELAAAMAVIGK
jgi:hypothetical protein